MRTPTLALIAIVSCKPDPGDQTLDDTGGSGPIDPSELTEIPPTLGISETAAVDCTDPYIPPEELTGEDGLGYHGWDWEDLEFKLRWSVSNRFDNNWISLNTGVYDSVRVMPQLVPEAGGCLKDAVTTGLSSSAPLAGALDGLSAYAHGDETYLELQHDRYVAPTYAPESEDTALYQALAGLHGLENPDPDAPSAGDWDPEAIWAVTQAWSPSAQTALADLVWAIGEAALLEEEALADMDPDAARRLHDAYLDERYTGSSPIFLSPYNGDVIDDTIDHADDLALRAYVRAGLRLAQATEAARLAMAAETPHDQGELDLATPWGRVVLSAADRDDVRTATDMDGVALLVDVAGDDVYDGQYAATPHFWMAAGVVLDLEGDDVYGSDTPDIESEDTRASDALDADYGFTQGAGLFGAGVLVDGGGDDLYMASVWAQGTGAFGVGLLADHGGADDYRLGLAGQGQGQFGVGLLADTEGNDRYGVYTYGQGVGRPGGAGLLLDGDGDDLYIAYYQALDPWLPEPGFPNHFGLTTSSMPYNDGENAHYMSIAQGTGWGYRGDWFDDYTNWMGGLGALIDLGEGNDEHYADNMSMGQGFIYGMGFLYDGGGDDLYRTFWWGPAASAHMGVGLFWEEGGDDDIHVTWASGGFGYDCSVAWMIDHGGDDVYSGQFHYGRAYTYGLTFMINEGGDDEYNAEADRQRTDPYFGTVIGGASTNLLGAFLDLGSGEDTYNTGGDGVGNDAVWYHAPSGDDVDPDLHKGIGIDR